MVNITSTLPTLTPQQIQAINASGMLSPQEEDSLNTSTSSHTLSSSEEYPTSMNLDLNGVQTIFPNQANTPQSSDDKNGNVNLSSQEEKPPTPMDM
jgi:hypothetical protein